MPVVGSMLPPPALTVHVTAVLDVPVTVVTKVCVAPSCTVAVLGETETTMGGGGGVVSVIEALAELDGVETDVARTVTAELDGICAGAV